MGTNWRDKAVSPRQREFIAKLIAERDAPSELIDRSMNAGTSGYASDRIGDLLACRPKAVGNAVPPLPFNLPPTGLDLSSMVSGRYVVPDDEELVKFKIDVVKEGRWEGWVFVRDGTYYGEDRGRKFGRQKPGELYYGEHADRLTAVLADPIAAAAQYGKVSGRCGICDKPLEVEDSVERGIGPVCYRRLTKGAA